MTEFETTAEQMAHIDRASLEEKVAYLLDRVQITDVLQRYGQCVDTHDFERLRTCYGDTIEVDHSPTIGMGRMRIPADRWCAMAETFHSQLDGDEHILIPQSIVINGDRASCHMLVHASHFYRQANGSPFQTLVGTYDLDLVKTADGWKICRSIQGVTWSEGNWQFHNDIKDSLAGS
ncbi:nuclear transport factor 2 family protein [Marinivivus vitaminiproducens]|uniref:nuclear transport factor 2 family protein n=1 Tax=Marinivivus vitaminiproducens TaxID=3035935 RepID=UPI0027999D8A|nr:nuclear transport factor 2 family protein [Geminicoccaceae bacterium SCSIO 64248]